LASEDISAAATTPLSLKIGSATASVVKSGQVAGLG
jgi:hypothetical protein